MNKDRRVVTKVLADVVQAYTGERTIPNKVLMVIRDAVKGLAETETRSVKKMEAFKDSENTAANYRNGVACRDDLLSAQDALEEGELEEALVFLQRVSDPEAVARRAPLPKPARPVKKRSRHA